MIDLHDTDFSSPSAAGEVCTPSFPNKPSPLERVHQQADEVLADRQDIAPLRDRRSFLSVVLRPTEPLGKHHCNLFVDLCLIREVSESEAGHQPHPEGTVFSNPETSAATQVPTSSKHHFYVAALWNRMLTGHLQFP